MDFVEALPCMHGMPVILYVIDRSSKYAHFIPLQHPYTASSLAHAFFEGVVRLHGLPQSIMSDQDPMFTRAFWQELLKLSCVRLHMSSVFHPQSDEQTEVVNKVIAMYLCCLTGDQPRRRLK